MDRLTYALFFFKEGFSCSQAVLTAFSKSFGLDRETALRISQAFGGGMARMSETCGTVICLTVILVAHNHLFLPERLYYSIKREFGVENDAE